MSEEDINARLDSFNKEPSTSGNTRAETIEHADLKHRIEIDAADERAAAIKPEPETSLSQSSAFLAPGEQPVDVARPALASDSQLPHAGPGIMVLQWLTYALWGWAVFSLSGLILMVVGQSLEDGSSAASYGASYWTGGIAYVLAAVIVLYVIALICDIFYSRLEKKHTRSTGSNVIMIIHAVIFALFGIGALIMAVFGGVNLLIGDGTSGTSGATTSVIGGIIIFGLYGLTLLRTLRPGWLKGVAPMYWAIITTMVAIAVTLGIIGPISTAKLKNQDTVIEQGLSGVAQEINQYTNDNGSLPASLDSISEGDLSEAAKKLVRENKVEYKPGELISNRDLTTFEVGSDQIGGTVKSVYHYELCVNYKTSNENNSYGSTSYTSEGQKYPTIVETYGHKAGNVCYDVQTSFTN